MSSSVARIRKGTLTFLIAALAGAATVVAACSSFSATVTDDDGGAAADSSSVDAFAPDSGVVAVDAADPDAATTSCSPLVAPATALSATSLTFTGFTTSAADASTDGWRFVGYDRDGLCTTATSTDVCKRVAGAPASAQADGERGIDNAWGHGIAPIIAGIGTLSSGSLVTDANGQGSLVLSGSGSQLVVPLRGTRLVVQGSSATLSAIVPVAQLAAAIKLLAGRFDVSLCSGATIDSILAQIRQTADILQNGTQTPTMTCDAISLGAALTGVVSGAAPAVDAGANPCLP